MRDHKVYIKPLKYSEYFTLLPFFSTVGLFARPPSHVSLQSLDAVLPSSPGRMGLDQTFTPHAIEASGVSEADINTPTSPSDIIIKDEPCDIDAVLIKWEMSEERFGEHQHSK